MSQSPAGVAVAPEVAGGVPAPEVGLAVVVPGAAELMRVLVAPAGVVGVAGAPVLTPGTGAPAGMPAPGITSYRVLECRTRQTCSVSNQQALNWANRVMAAQSHKEAHLVQRLLRE